MSGESLDHCSVKFFCGGDQRDGQEEDIRRREKEVCVFYGGGLRTYLKADGNEDIDDEGGWMKMYMIQSTD